MDNRTILGALLKIFSLFQKGEAKVTINPSAAPATTISTQDTHDNLNCNANIQVEDSDVTSVNPLPVEVIGGSSSSINATHRSPVDFTAAYTSNVTITLSGHPTISNSAQVSYIKIVPTTGDSAILVNGSGGITMSYSANVITVTGDTPFVTGDVYEVGINLQDKSYDSGLDITKSIEQAPLWKRYTPSEPIVTASDIGVANDTWINQGIEVDVRGYKSVRPFIKLVVNDSTGNQLRILTKDEFGGTDIYEAKDAANYEESLDNVGGTDWNPFLPYLDVTGFHSIQFQTKATLIGTIEATVTIDITKEY